MGSSKALVARNITDKRLLARIKQEDVARLLSKSSATISNWEQALSVPTVVDAWKLADYYNCSIDELVGRDIQKGGANG